MKPKYEVKEEVVSAGFGALTKRCTIIDTEAPLKGWEIGTVKHPLVFTWRDHAEDLCAAMNDAAEKRKTRLAIQADPEQ